MADSSARYLAPKTSAMGEAYKLAKRFGEVSENPSYFMDSAGILRDSFGVEHRWCFFIRMP